MTMKSVLAWITMNPTAPFMVDGDLATMWRRFAAVTIGEQVEAVANLGMPIDPRPLPARRRPFPRTVAAIVVAVEAVVIVAVAAVVVAVAANDVKSCANRTLSC